MVQGAPLLQCPDATFHIIITRCIYYALTYITPCLASRVRETESDTQNYWEFILRAEFS